jgi:hypothetical protein
MPDVTNELSSVFLQDARCNQRGLINFPTCSNIRAAGNLRWQRTSCWFKVQQNLIAASSRVHPSGRLLMRTTVYNTDCFRKFVHNGSQLQLRSTWLLLQSICVLNISRMQMFVSGCKQSSLSECKLMTTTMFASYIGICDHR